MSGTAYQEKILKSPGTKKARYGTLMMVEDASGNATFVGEGSPLPITTSASASSNYEAKSFQLGTSADGYNVKVTGGMFSIVTESSDTTIKNRAGNSGTITVYLKEDGQQPIVIGAGESITVDKLKITNLFIDTSSSFGATEYIDIILFG